MINAKRFSAHLFIAVHCMLFNPAVRAETLTVYTWEEYLADEVVDAWEKETGIGIKQVYYDTDDERNAVLASSSGDNFDLVVFDDVSNRVIGDSGLLVTVTEKDVPNARHIDQRWQGSCQNYGVPYFWGTVGIIYRSDRFEHPPSSWRDLLQPAPEHQGHVVMYQDAIDSLIGPLVLQGEKLSSNAAPALREAHRMLIEQTPHVLSWEYVLTYAKDPAQREQIHMALGFSGDQYTLMEMAPEEQWEFIVPSEGTTVWIDCIGVMQASAKRDAAMRFVNFISAPKVAAMNSQGVYVATPNRSAYQHLDPEFIVDEGVFPSSAILDRSETYASLPADALRQRNRIVASVVRKHESQ